MIEMLLEIKEIVAVIISLVISVIVLVGKLIKTVRSKTKLNNLISLEALTLDFVKEAEKFLNFSGNEKKEWVKTKVNQYAIKNDINYDDEAVSNIIESLILVSKKVNQREKDRGVLL